MNKSKGKNSLIVKNRFLFELDIMFNSGGFFPLKKGGAINYVQWTPNIEFAYNESLVVPKLESFCNLTSDNVCTECGYPASIHGFLLKEQRIVCPNNYIVPIGSKLIVFTPVEFIDFKQKHSKNGY